MPVHRLLHAAALVAASLLSNIAHADTFVYSVANHFSSFQVDGTITTDTNQGILTFDNIMDYNLLLTTGAGSESLTTANADNAGLYGYALTATETGLFFDYSADQAGLFFQNSMTGTYLCIQTYGCDSGQSSHESVSLQGNTYTEAQSGVVQIATLLAPTPEPSSLLLLGTGALGALGVVRRRAAIA